MREKPLSLVGLGQRAEYDNAMRADNITVDMECVDMKPDLLEVV